MTTLQSIAAANNWNLRVNENFVSSAPAALYGIDPSATTGLTLAYLGGQFNGVTVANGAVVLTASATNYVVVNLSTGVVSAATTTTNWLATTTYLQLYQVVTGTSTVTTLTDFRQAIGKTGGGGGTPGGSPTQIQYNNSSTFAGDAGMVYTLGTQTAGFVNVTLAGLLATAASATGSAGLRVPHGVAPTAPVNGDLWTTTTGLYASVNGATVGPFATAAGTLANPMTTQGDVIYGGAAGVPTRLAGSTSGFVLTSAGPTAAPVWAAATGGNGDMLSPLLSAEISITAAATLTIGRQHVCSGTSADYAVTLPAVSGNTGKFLSVRMAVGLTRWVTLTGNGAELIDGSNTRRMWARESAILYCDGGGWTKVAGRSIPVEAKLYRSTVLSLATTGWWPVPCIDAVVYDNTSGLAAPVGNLTSGSIKIPRTSRYQVSAFCSFAGVAATKSFAIGAVNYTGASYTPPDGPWSYFLADGTGAIYGSASGPMECTMGADLLISVYNGDTATRNTSTGASTRPSIAVMEIPSW